MSPEEHTARTDAAHDCRRAFAISGYITSEPI